MSSKHVYIRKGTATSCELKLITCKSGSSSRSCSSLSSEAIKRAQEAFKKLMARNVRESLQMATNPGFFGPRIFQYETAPAPRLDMEYERMKRIRHLDEEGIFKD